MGPPTDGDKTIAQLDNEAIEKFNKKLKEDIDREAKMQRHFLWRGNKIIPFSIEPMPFPRQRLAEPMTAEDRLLRKQWLSDQALSPNEPRFIPELYPRNPIRRFIGKPWDMFFGMLKPIIGKSRADTGRFFVPKIVMATFFGYAVYYHMKYNFNTWQDRHGWNIYGSKQPVYHLGKNLYCVPNCPWSIGINVANPSIILEDRLPPKEGDDFYDRGFKHRKVLRD